MFKKKLKAVDLLKHMIRALVGTGHPWITFKDKCNTRSPQQHYGVVHSSNLCTEITLNTNEEEIAVCNLGSINLVNYWSCDIEERERIVRTAVRMLDNVVDINFYPVEKAERSNRRHRPIGLGIMGFEDLHLATNIPRRELSTSVMKEISTYLLLMHLVILQKKKDLTVLSVDLCGVRECYLVIPLG